MHLLNAVQKNLLNLIRNRGESAALGHCLVSIFFGKKTIKNLKKNIVASQYNSLALFKSFFIWNIFLFKTFIKNENSVFPILIEKNFEQKIHFYLLKMRSIFKKNGNPFFFIKLGQRLPKSFSQLHVKNSRFFLSYFWKKDDWPKAYAGPRLPTLPYVTKM